MDIPIGNEKVFDHALNIVFASSSPTRIRLQQPCICDILRHKFTIPNSIYEALRIQERHKATLEEYIALENCHLGINDTTSCKEDSGLQTDTLSQTKDKWKYR